MRPIRRQGTEKQKERARRIKQAMRDGTVSALPYRLMGAACVAYMPGELELITEDEYQYCLAEMDRQEETDTIVPGH